MTHSLLVATLLLGAACGADVPVTRVASPGGPVLPDTQSVDGVLVMRHAAAAFTRAPQWQVEDSATVTFDGGDDPDLDLTYTYHVAFFPDGSLLAVNRINSGRVMLFPADGGPGRMVAAPGEGPGEVRSPNDAIPFGDSIAVVDDATGRVNWFTAADGWAGSESHRPNSNLGCLGVSGVMADRRVLAVNRCLTGQSELPREGGRLPAELLTATLDFTTIDTIAILPGVEMIWFETRYGGARTEYPMMPRFARTAYATIWGSRVASSTDRNGYVIERRRIDGTVDGRLEVTISRRPVTKAMRESVIATEIERLESGTRERPIDPVESRRVARELPFADSLAPYNGLINGADGVLWVLDGRAPTDTIWAATGFRENGEIQARITGRGRGVPMLFLDDRVLVRETDDDGIVRFVARRIAKD